ncbi:nuclease-related domain-containing protein [Streptomyces noursei]|uniref:nuclease-related domain-containing protein n=1 Tax=Streptomyces noursei TaxID=1971 RepID=UPI0035E0FD9B
MTTPFMDRSLIEALLLLATIAWLRRRWRTRPGAGASAATRARQLRTPLVRAADAFGISTRASQQAARYQAGAVGEERTATRLKPLSRENWTVLHDRALPRGRANVDHLAISPVGTVFVADTKRWSSRSPLTVHGGRLRHGDRDVTDRLNGLRHEASVVSAVLRVPVIPIVVIDGAPLVGPYGRPSTQLVLDGMLIVPASRLTAVLRANGRSPGPRPAPELAAAAQHLLPPYTHRQHHHGRRR